MSFEIKTMGIEHYDEVIALWTALEGICIGDMDSRAAIESYLNRNNGFSRVAFNEQGRIVGAVLCGHDGRRGFLHHLGVASDYQRSGLGASLFHSCCAALAEPGFYKVHMFVLAGNAQAIKFWKKIGCEQRGDILIFSYGIKK